MTESTDKSRPVVSTLDHKILYLDDDRNTKLHYAAAQGNIEKVEQELKNGHKIDVVNYLGWTPLMMAARFGHIEVVKILLEKFSDSTKKNKFGFSIFHVSIASGKLELVAYVLQHLLRGGVTKKSMEGVLSPISLAVLFNHLHLLQFLIDQSFCVNSLSFKTELTPVMFAAAMGNPEIFNYLASRGADTDPNTTGPKISEILKYKQKLIDHQVLRNNIPPPLMIIHSPAVPPQTHQIFPMHSPSNYCPHFLRVPRKCSELDSPFFSPLLSPIAFPTMSPFTPINNNSYISGFTPQVFFPPDFSPVNLSSPYNSHNYDFLNTVFHQNAFCVPFQNFYQ